MFAVPLDSYNEKELEFCKEFNREFKNIKADRHSLERMATRRPPKEQK